MAALHGLVLFTERLYAPTGHVYQYMTRLTQRFGVNARQECPFRTGHLRESIDVPLPARVGPKQILGTISVDAHYALYVLKGTYGPIHSHAFPEKRMKLGTPNPNGRTAPFAMEVSGQEANNFLLRAWDQTARRHPSIRGVEMPEF